MLGKLESNITSCPAFRQSTMWRSAELQTMLCPSGVKQAEEIQSNPRLIALSFLVENCGAILPMLGGGITSIRVEFEMLLTSTTRKKCEEVSKNLLSGEKSTPWTSAGC